MANIAASSRGGSKPGERRGGRKPGTPNKVTADLRAIAAPYSAGAIETLHGIMVDTSAPPQARVAAARELLDRGHGRPTQSVDVTTKGRRIFVPGSDLPDFSPSAPVE